MWLADYLLAAQILHLFTIVYSPHKEINGLDLSLHHLLGKETGLNGT